MAPKPPAVPKGKGKGRAGRGGGGRHYGRETPRRPRQGAPQERDSYETLGKLVSKATKPTRETGYKRLDEDVLRRIKGVAKQDEACASGAARYLMQRLEAKSAEVRYMALSVVGELFQRSRIVREMLVADLKTFMVLAVGHDARQPLPGPPAAAAALRERALALMEAWNDSFGDRYKGLRAAYRFLREGRRMKFPELQVRAAREREAAVRREKHAQRLLRAKYQQAKAEIEDQAPDIETLAREMEECFAILVPAVPGADAITAAEHTGTPATKTTSVRSSSGSSDSKTVLPKGPDSSARAHRVTSLEADGPRAHDWGAGERRRRRRPWDTVSSGDGEDGTGFSPSEPGHGRGKETGGSRQDDGPNGRGHPVNGDGIGDENGTLAGVLNEKTGSFDGTGSEAEARDADGSDEDEGMEWEDGDAGLQESENGVHGAGRKRARSDDEEEDDQGEEEPEGDDGGVFAGRPKVGGGALRTVHDTVEAAGLGSSAYELQVEVPMGWSLTASNDSGDAASVVSALRERYKVLSQRILPLLSEWIRTLSQVNFDEHDGTSDDGCSGSGVAHHDQNRSTDAAGDGANRRSAGHLVAAAEERRTCARLLSRCVALRTSANTVASKYIELKVDESFPGGDPIAGPDATGSKPVGKSGRLMTRADFPAADTAGQGRKRQVRIRVGNHESLPLEMKTSGEVP